MLTSHPHLHVVNSIGYLEMLILEQGARLILTDSGGILKEAYFVGTPCVTMQNETEWPETMRDGWNTLVGIEWRSILSGVNSVFDSVQNIVRQPRDLALFGSGKAGACSVENICAFLGAS